MIHGTLLIENIAPEKAGASSRLLLCMRNRMIYFGDDPPEYRLVRFAWRRNAGGRWVYPGRSAEDSPLTALLCAPIGHRDAEERRFRECLRHCTDRLGEGITDLVLPRLNEEGKMRAARLFAHHPIRVHETADAVYAGGSEEATFWIPSELGDRASFVVIDGIPVFLRDV